MLGLCLAAPLSAAGAGGVLGTAREALARGDAIAAEVALDQALDQGIARGEVAADMGEALLMQGKLDEARDWLEGTQFTPAQRQRGFHMLARLETSEGHYEAASQAFESAIGAGPTSATIWVDYGRMRYAAGAQHLAVEASLEAFRADPEDPRALEFRGQLVRDSRGMIAALPWFAEGLKHAPDDLGLLGEYAATLGEAGRWKDMLKVTRRMIELNGKDPRAFFLQAVMAVKAGKTTLARRLLNRTGVELQNIPAAMLLDGLLDLQAGNTALAVENFAELARIQPDNAEVRNLFAQALLENGEANEVVARFAPAADGPGADPWLLTLVGRSYETLGRRDLAAAYLDRAASRGPQIVVPMDVGEAGELALYRWGDDPFRLEAMVPAIRTALVQGNTAEAGAIAERLRERYVGSADVEVLAGDVALARGDGAAALEQYRAAAEVRRTFALSEKMVAAYGLLGDQRAANAEASDFLIQHPTHGRAALLVAQLAAGQGDWQRARALLLFAKATGRIARDPWAMGLLAESELRLGNNAAGLAAARNAYALQRNNGRNALLLAQALQANGKPGADRMLAKARGLGASGG